MNEDDYTATFPELETVYVTGNLDIGKINQDFILDLNYSTIYCEGDIDIGGKTTVKGSGCIIAQGDINFQPNMLSGEDDFVFVMSIFGTVDFQPRGTLYGSVAGREVYLGSGNILTHTNPDVDLLNFPVADVESAQHIRTWEISLQKE